MTRTCETCNETLPEVARFCSRCGASLDGDAYPEPREERRGLPVWACAIIAVPVLVLGAIAAAIPLMALFSFRPTPIAGNEVSAVGSLRSIAAVQAIYRDGDMDNDSFADYATSLTELSQARLIDNILGRGVRQGYAFGLSGSTFDWIATATPVTPSSGTRNFIVCTDGVIRFSPAGPATCSSPAIQ